MSFFLPEISHFEQESEASSSEDSSPDSQDENNFHLFQIKPKKRFSHRRGLKPTPKTNLQEEGPLKSDKYYKKIFHFHSISNHKNYLLLVTHFLPSEN